MRVEPRLLHPCFFTPHLLLLLLNTEDEWVEERNEQEVDQKRVRSSQNEMEEIRVEAKREEKSGFKVENCIESVSSEQGSNPNGCQTGIWGAAGRGCEADLPLSQGCGFNPPCLWQEH